MKIDLSGHHVDITDGIRDAVSSKFQKISSHYPDIEKLVILLNVERNEQTVDAHTQYLGHTVNVKASHVDLYAAIAEAVKKLDAALNNKKGSAKAGLHSKIDFS